MRKEAVNAYVTALDELNIIMLESYYAADPKKKVKDVVDDLFSLLVEAYLLGIDHAGEMMNQVIVMEASRMEAAVYHRIGGLDFTDRAAEHIRNGDTAGLQTLAVSEYHRVYNEAVNDGVQQVIRESGGTAMKTWRTMRDERVRETHWNLEGVTIPIGEVFTASDGDQALLPGGFSNADNNVNCRCFLEYRRVNS